MKDIWSCCFDKEKQELRYVGDQEFHGAFLSASIDNDEPLRPEEVDGNSERYQRVTKLALPCGPERREWIFADVVAPGIYKIVNNPSPDVSVPVHKGDLVEVEMRPHSKAEGYGECFFSRKVESA